MEEVLYGTIRDENIVLLIIGILFLFMNIKRKIFLFGTLEAGTEG